MDFDASRVYNALNADMLKPGSKCFFADSLGGLKLSVKDGDCPKVLDEVLNEDFIGRFVVKGENYVLAYLIDEPVPLKWTDLEIGDKLRHRTSGVIHMVIGMDPDVNAERHVFLGCTWYSDEALADWERAEDYHG